MDTNNKNKSTRFSSNEGLGKTSAAESRHPPSGFGQPSLPSALTLQPNINPPYNLPSSLEGVTV
ncbi:3876_t:CDS:2 [Entrophospora sp. SA101]|nr:3876_t:CDS:2 [Entrophospora sp. SA101]